MKIRGGFVSNSSSSSFVIGIKDGEMLKNGLNANVLTRILGVENGTPLYNLSKSIAEYISANATEQDEESIMADYGYDKFEDAIADRLLSAKMLSEGYRIFTMRASYNETDNPIEMLLGNGGLDDLKVDGIVFKREY